MIFGIVASRSVRRSVVSVLDAVIENDGPIVTFGNYTFEPVGAAPSEAELIEMIFGGFEEGQRITPGDGWYTLNLNTQFHGKFSRAPDIGANEQVKLEYSPNLGGDGEQWHDTGYDYQALEGNTKEFLIRDLRYEDVGISYHLRSSRSWYYRVSLVTQAGDVIEISEPVQFIFYADELHTPSDTVRSYWDSLFSSAELALTDGNELSGYSEGRFWNDNTELGPNRFIYDATLQRVKPSALAGVSASRVGIDTEADWNTMFVRAKIFCPASTPGLGAGGGMVFTDNGSPQVELFRWVWQGNKLRTITPSQTDEYTVPGGTLSLVVEMRMVQGSFGIVNVIVDDNYDTVWEGNNPSIPLAIDLTAPFNITLIGTPGAAVDSWEYVKTRATVNYFDPGQAN